MHAAKHESILKVDSIIFNGFGRVCPKCPRKITIFLWYLRKEIRNKVKDLTFASAGLNSNLTIYYKSLTEIHFLCSAIWSPSQAFLQLINCLISISLLFLFHITVGPCKLACLFMIRYFCVKRGWILCSLLAFYLFSTKISTCKFLSYY